MIRSRLINDCALAVEIKPPFAELAKVATALSISLSSSSHFAHKLYSNIIKPVALPPGRDKLLTKPDPTGSGTIANTDGTVRVAWSNAPAPRLPKVRMTSGARAANSAAYLRVSATLPPDQRYTICKLLPSTQPNSRSPSTNVAMRAFDSGSSEWIGASTPMRRIRPDCCARAAIGHAAAAPPSSDMKSRRLRAGMVSTPPSAAGFLSLARRDRPVLGATLNRSELGGRRQAVARSGRSQVHSFFVALLVCDLHGSSEMSLCHSGSDQALAVLVRTFPNAPVASANLATLSPLADSTTSSRSCSPDVR